MFRNRLIWLIIIASCLRILVAYITELDNDEAYYFTYALHLQWNYFDHPPGVALLIRLSTLNLLFTNELFIRLGSIICAAIGTWLSYCIGKFIRNERTGFYAAILYNTSVYSSIIAGVFILPDSPQIVFWLAALLMLLKIIIAYESNNRIKLFNWLLFGFLTGLCILCKIHGIFLWIGLGLYALIYKRKMFSDIGVYLSFVLMLILISPIIFWNLNNHFVTYAYHSNRVAVRSVTINAGSFFQAIIGQILYNNPINVFLIIQSFFFLKRKQFLQPSSQRILLLTGLPVIIVVTIISLFNSILPHWSGPGFVTITFFAAAYLDKTTRDNLFTLPKILKYSTTLIISFFTVAVFLFLFYPGTIGSKNKDNYGSGDFTLDMSGWKNFSTEYKQWMHQQADNNEIKNLKFVCNKWFPAAHIEYYLAYPMHTKLIGIGKLNDLHNFAWLNRIEDLKKGENALCIIPSNYNENVKAVYGNQFSSIMQLHIFTEKRDGRTSRFFTLYLLKNYKANDAVHKLELR